MKSKLIEELAANLEITVCWVFLKINFIQNNIFVEK
jgi:hypothetical protein